MWTSYEEAPCRCPRGERQTRASNVILGHVMFLGIFARCYASFTDVDVGLLRNREKEIDCLAFRTWEFGKTLVEFFAVGH